jgi:hypothetical protein
MIDQHLLGVPKMINPMNSKFYYKIVSPPEDDDEPEDNDGEECETCGRKFNVPSYAKHIKICKKVFASKRKAFNTRGKRVIDSEHAMLIKNVELEEKKKAKMLQNKKGKEDDLPKKDPKWKKQSEQFRNVLKNARIEEAGGQVSTKQVVNPDYDDYKHCGICNRKYNEDAYKKHLAMCERRQKEAIMKGNNKVVNNHAKPNLNVKFTKK